MITRRLGSPRIYGPLCLAAVEETELRVQGTQTGRGIAGIAGKRPIALLILADGALDIRAPSGQTMTETELTALCPEAPAQLRAFAASQVGPNQVGPNPDDPDRDDPTRG